MIKSRKDQVVVTSVQTDLLKLVWTLGGENIRWNALAKITVSSILEKASLNLLRTSVSLIGTPVRRSRGGVGLL